MRALDFMRQLAPDLNDESPVFREMSVLEAQARGIGLDSFQLAVRDWRICTRKAWPPA